MRRAFCVALAYVAAIGVLAPSVASAAFTSIGASSIATEHNHEQILEHVYGGNFVTTGVLSFTNGSITATRIEDTSSASLTPVNTVVSIQQAGPIGLDDQLWSGAFSGLAAKASFAWFDEDFGYTDGATGGTHHMLIHPGGDDYALTNTTTATTVDQQIFRWSRGGESRVVTSQIADHPDGKDHMLTYKITGLANGATVNTWLLFFEDKFVGEKVDFDYNDLVVQIQAAVLVPEPTFLAPAALVGLCMRSRRRTIA